MNSSSFSQKKYNQKALNAAINWIKNQPEAVKKLIENANDLMSLYQEDLAHNKKEKINEFQKNLVDLSKKVTASSVDNSNAELVSVDPQTLATLKMVTQKLNLKSEQEALKMLVSLGLEKLEVL